jgi:zinc/manganese transport system substrate-binding protein
MKRVHAFDGTPVAGAGAAALAAAALLIAGCDARGPAAAGGRIPVVAGESVWGGIAAQVGGPLVEVTSLIANPATDPHDYEPAAADARAVARAQVTIANGIGYDAWMSHLVAASRSDGTISLDVGRITGVRTGGNPHRWYDPADVVRVARAIAAAFGRAEPSRAAYFRRRAAVFVQRGLASYRALIAQIRRRFAGVRVGASESIFAPLAEALGLRLVTPGELLRAVSEGTDPSAGAKATADRQIARHEISLWVYNRQNASPDVARLTSAARHARIAVVTISETPIPAAVSFQSWQVAQLRALERALAGATGR